MGADRVSVSGRSQIFMGQLDSNVAQPRPSDGKNHKAVKMGNLRGK